MHQFWINFSSQIEIDAEEEEFIASSAPEPEMFCIMESRNKRAQKIWLGLTEIEKTIIGEVVIKEETLHSVGEKLGYSAERIRQKKNDKQIQCIFKQCICRKRICRRGKKMGKKGRREKMAR